MPPVLNLHALNRRQGLAAITTVGLALTLTACSGSLSQNQQGAANQAMAFVKKATPHTAVAWNLVSVKQGTYGQLNHLAPKKLAGLQVYEVTIQGSTEIPICPSNAKPGTKCTEKLIPATDEVFIAVSSNKVIAVTSEDHSIVNHGIHTLPSPTAKVTPKPKAKATPKPTAKSTP